MKLLWKLYTPQQKLLIALGWVNILTWATFGFKMGQRHPKQK